VERDGRPRLFMMKKSEGRTSRGLSCPRAKDTGPELFTAWGTKYSQEAVKNSTQKMSLEKKKKPKGNKNAV